jgi:hypothetical protein
MSTWSRRAAGMGRWVHRDPFVQGQPFPLPQRRRHLLVGWVLRVATRADGNDLEMTAFIRGWGKPEQRLLISQGTSSTLSIE